VGSGRGFPRGVFGGKGVVGTGISIQLPGALPFIPTGNADNICITWRHMSLIHNFNFILSFFFCFL